MLKVQIGGNMYKLKKIFSPRSMIVWLTAIIFLISFQFANQPSQTQTQAVVRAIVIDKQQDDQVTASVLVVTSMPQGANKFKVFTSEGETLTQTINKLSLQMGKDIGFGQCDVMAVGEGICKGDATLVLDYLTRTRKVGRNAVLINFSGDSEDFANCIVQFQENFSLNIADIVNYNQTNISATESSVESFFKGYYSPIGISVMPKISVYNEKVPNSVKVPLPNGGGGASSSQSGDSSGGGGGQTQKEVYFVNDGTTSVFKNGVKFIEYSPTEMSFINLLENEDIYGNFKLDNITSDIYNNATLMLQLTYKTLDAKYYFKDNTPCVKYSIDMYVRVEEVIEQGRNQDLLHAENWSVDDVVVERIKQHTTNNLDLSLNDLKQNNADIVKVYENFNKFKHKKWKKYLESLEDKDQYLKNVQFEYDIKIFSEY